MPEFRQDPLSERWVIIAEDRAGRPSEFDCQPARRALNHCPFCAGSEHDTPDPIAIYPRGAPRQAWQVRVIPNKYPAVVPGSLDSPDSSRSTGGPLPPNPFVAVPAVGVHEVIVESPRHLSSYTELAAEQAELSLRVYQDRLSALSQDPRLRYALLFKNCRGGSGATLEHVHSQLLATNIVPTDIEQRLQLAGRYFDQTGRCLVCELLRQELLSRARIVHESSQFVAVCPFASRFPYETWVLPRTHGSRFELADPRLLAELAGILRAVLGKLEKLSANAAYNLWIHTAPFRVHCETSFHWRIELIPRVTTQAGYEWGSGCFVNPVSPESAARWLRESQ
jgi:UDPglucose--hexose-1-phosphate uridylyltransferase